MNFKNSGGLEMLVTFVYASNEETERREVWEDLVHTSRVVGKKKWLITRDFIELMFSYERFGQGNYSDLGPSKF